MPRSNFSDTEDSDVDEPPQQKSSGKPVVLCDDDSDDDDSLPLADPRRPHLCKVCKKGFLTKQHCKTHERTVHLGKKPWRCSECDRRFGQKQTATRHQALHTNNPKPWLCPVCKHTFSQRFNAQTHVKKVHGFELPDIPKIGMPKIAVIEKDADDDEVESTIPISKKATNKQSRPVKEPKPPAGRVKITPSTGQKRKRAQESDVDSLLDYSKPKDNPVRRQQVMQAKSEAVSGDKRKKRKQSVSSGHDSGFDEEYDSPTSKSRQASAGGVESDDDVRDFKFKFDYEIPVVAEVE